MNDPSRSMVGLVGTLVVGCRGADGPGEVQLSIRGGREYFTAFADTPLPAGATVLVIEAQTNRNLVVVEWLDPSLAHPLA